MEAAKTNGFQGGQVTPTTAVHFSLAENNKSSVTRVYNWASRSRTWKWCMYGVTAFREIRLSGVETWNKHFWHHSGLTLEPAWTAPRHRRSPGPAP